MTRGRHERIRPRRGRHARPPRSAALHARAPRSAVPGARARARRSLDPRLTSALGELLATAGAVALLYGVYSVYWTTAEAQGAARQEVQSLQQKWEREARAESRPGTATAGTGTAGTGNAGTRTEGKGPAAGKGPASRQGDSTAAADPPPAPGATFALLRIPRLGSDWISPILQGRARGAVGLDPRDLDRGVVHYPYTAVPGRIGNFAVAGHRATHGEPFKDLDRLRPGDELTVETRRQTLTYAVTGSAIVPPTRVDVIAPVPGYPEKKADVARMTLTTCHPRWASTLRLVVWAKLIDERTRGRSAEQRGETPGA